MSIITNGGRFRTRSAYRLCCILALTACLFAASCASKAAQRRDAMTDALDSGDYAGIIQSIKGNQKQMYGDAGAFLYNMDLGVLYHYVGDYDSSGVYLQRAAEIYDELFTRSVTNEAAALLTNDNVRPYRARPYELTMLHQIAALNFMLQGRFEDALVETRKIQILFNEWERTRADSDKYYTDGMSHLFSSLAFESENEIDNSLISLFKSVQAFKTGVVALPPEVEGFAFDRLTAGDRSEDVGLLGISANAGANRWTAKQGEAEIIVVGYAGRSPTMNDVTWRGTYDPRGYLQISVAQDRGDDRHRVSAIRIPAPPLPSDNNSLDAPLHITLSLPYLRTIPAESARFSARLNGQGERYLSAVVNDIELQAQKALDDAWAEILARTVVRVVLRTIAAEQAKSRVDTGNPLGNALLGLSVNVATDQMEKADIRMCFVLPKEIHVARFPVEPGVHGVVVNVYDPHGAVVGEQSFDNIEVKRGEKKVLVHRSMF